MNLPNKLTTLRVLLVPVFVVLLLLSPETPWLRWIAIAVFVIASITDLLDGKLARKMNLVTNFGKFMDPLADKLLVCSAMICMIRLDLMPVWAVLIIVAREFIISGFRLVAAEQGLVLAASYIAKVKTTVQMIMIIALMIPWSWKPFAVICQILIIASVILTVVSLADYFAKNKSVLQGEM